MEVLGRPMILILIEYRAIIIRIPDNNPFILPLVCSKPVIDPAARPPNKAANVDNQGEYPFDIMIATIAPPVVKLPSTVRSGKSRIRNVIYTPSAISAYSRPSSNAPGKEFN